MSIIYSKIKPTVLAVKKHSITGKLYFCKTTFLDEVYSYPGSGTHWKRHLNKHGKNVKTLWVSDVYYNTSIVESALQFSKLHDIVKSKLWANQKPENGLDGGDNSQFIDYDKTISKGLQTKNSTEWKETKGKERAKKQSISLSNTMNCSEWLETVGHKKAENVSLALTGKKKTKEHKKNIALAKKGCKSNKGYVYNIVECPHCGTKGAGGNMKRWHFDKCKNR